jgi:uncharacterized protein YjgD (DUF1641 family)
MEANDALELERLTAAARDSLTDEMVSRLSATVAEGVDLLDRINRSGVARALPAVAQLVENGDLDRLVALARTYGAAQDALTDEMVSRVAQTASESLSIMDRLHRAGAERLVDAFARLANSGALERLDTLGERLTASFDLLERIIGALESANRELETKAAAGGGLGGLWRIMREPENQETLRFLLALGRGFRNRGVRR